MRTTAQLKIQQAITLLQSALYKKFEGEDYALEIKENEVSLWNTETGEYLVREDVAEAIANELTS